MIVKSLPRYHTKRIGKKHYSVLVQAILAVHPEPLNIIDIGCSVGELLFNFPDTAETSKETVYKAGVDIEENVRSFVTARGIDFQQLDIDKWDETDNRPFATDHFGLICCMEVPEHIKYEEKLLKYIDLCSPGVCHTLVWSAAPPGQPGKGHINCQPKEFWVEKLAAHGWTLDEEATATFLEIITGKVSHCYLNTAIYRKS